MQEKYMNGKIIFPIILRPHGTLLIIGIMNFCFDGQMRWPLTKDGNKELYDDFTDARGRDR